MLCRSLVECIGIYLHSSFRCTTIRCTRGNLKYTQTAAYHARPRSPPYCNAMNAPSLHRRQAPPICRFVLLQAGCPDYNSPRPSPFALSERVGSRASRQHWVALEQSWKPRSPEARGKGDGRGSGGRTRKDDLSGSTLRLHGARAQPDDRISGSSKRCQ